MATGDPAFDPDRLLAAARQVRRNAYAPYSGFSVGAALLEESGRIHLGVNVENASYGLSACAEWSAIASAVTIGARSFRAIAVAGPRDEVPCMPCGRCRQILHELAPDLIVVVAEPSGGSRTMPLTQLLPSAFDAQTLRTERPVES